MRKLLSFLFILLLPASALAAAPLQISVQGRLLALSDVPGDAWFSSYVKAAAEAGIVSGYADAKGNLTGKFGPADNVTVEQALKIAVNGAGFDLSRYAPMNDASASTWLAPYLGVAAKENIYPFGSFVGTEYHGPATRGQLAQIVADAFHVPQPTPQRAPFLDVSLASSFLLPIGALSADGVITGDTDAAGNPTNHFRPDDHINRAEAAKIVMAARAKYGTPGSDRQLQASSAPAAASQSPVIVYKDSGFVPAQLDIQRGASAVFVNQSSRDLLVDSDPHPTHTSFPAMNQTQVLHAGQTVTILFDAEGQNVGYHNHLHASDRGTIRIHAAR